MKNRRLSSSEYRRRDRAALWHPYTRFSELEKEDFPLIERGKGPYLFDLEGKRYFDAIASWWSCSLGHSHPAVVRAIRRQATKLQHSILGNLSHRPAIELAERLQQLLHGTGKRYYAFFASDGASAVEAALKIAVQYWYNCGQPQKNGLAALEEGYHGDTLATVSLGYLEAFHRPFREIVLPVHRVEAPRCTRCPYGGTPQDCDFRCLESLASLLRKQAPRLAAFVLESMFQGAAGMWPYRAGYLQRAAELCRQHRVLLVADEIAAGMGRTGRLFAFEHAGIAPDIICLGKALTAGTLPLSVTLVAEEIHRTFSDIPRDNTFYHGHTFSGNPVAAAAALATLQVYEDEAIVPGAASTGRHLQEQGDRFREHPLVTDVRGIGMMWAAELRNPALARELRRRLWQRGVLIRPLGAVVYLMPPLNTPAELLDQTLDLLFQELECLRGKAAG